jgi:hypothetical protein
MSSDENSVQLGDGVPISRAVAYFDDPSRRGTATRGVAVAIRWQLTSNGVSVGALEPGENE